MAIDATALLRAEGEFAIGRVPVPLARLACIVLGCAALHGAVIGSLGGNTLGALYSLCKLPLLLTIAFALCLPNFFVVNALLGLRADFPRAVRAILSTQGTLALALAVQSPVVAFFYLSRIRYSEALLLNGLVFALATIGAQTMLARHYRALIERDRRHRLALIAWFVLYVFVSIQLGSVLRPFVGDPDLPTSFFRPHPWTENPYKTLFWTVAGFGWSLVRTLFGG